VQLEKIKTLNKAVIGAFKQHSELPDPAPAPVQEAKDAYIDRLKEASRSHYALEMDRGDICRGKIQEHLKEVTSLDEQEISDLVDAAREALKKQVEFGVMDSCWFAKWLGQ